VTDVTLSNRRFAQAANAVGPRVSTAFLRKIRSIDYQSLGDVVSLLASTLPKFDASWAVWCEDNDEPGLHSAYNAAREAHADESLSELQIKMFALIINEAVAAGGRSENAVSTCFLEAMGRDPAEKLLRSYFSKEAKARS
jgi:hypothetical protein